MLRKVDLSVKTPCSKKFNQFTPTTAGGFCGSCQQEVIDFTKMSDQEILAFFQNASSHTCGRFHSSQLKTYKVAASAQEKRKFNIVGASLMALSALTILPFNGQAQQIPQAPSAQIAHSVARIQSTIHADYFTVSGVITDEADGSPLPGVNVVIKGTNQGTVTDVDGKYQIKVKADDILIFSYVGYDYQEFSVAKNKGYTMDVQLSADGEILGAVEVHKEYRSKRSIWQKFKSIFQAKHHSK